MTFDSPQNGYNVRKRISLDVLPRDGKYVYQPGILYRIAEAYLGYAEALNESSPDVYKRQSVESPIGPFFGQGWDERYNYASLPLSAGPENGTGLS